MALPVSKLVRKQTQEHVKKIDGMIYVLNLRFDDHCGNGNNDFSITLDTYRGRRTESRLDSCGCQHEEVKRIFPEFSHLIAWHLCSTKGPMHYVANTIYHVKGFNLKFARSTAIAPLASFEQLGNEKWLLDRLPALMVDFKEVIESLGFEY